jgi:hypothetical protein
MLVRVAEPDKPAFQLRKGEEGLSVFDTEAAQPPLTEEEILSSFRPGCIAILRPNDSVLKKGLIIAPILGAETLPQRLREAHVEIVAGAGMSRGRFKQLLKEFE